jgi:GDP/UDP-N,N'-diacetylbacillosamine 2-epimerase (hydrolysing)
MKIAVLTSSRADFGIYIPLLKLLKTDPQFTLEIIAFGTHLSKNHGYTINEILDSGYDVKHQLSTPLLSDTPQELAHSIAKTTEIFADFWTNYTFDLVITLGDRYEMYAAVSASSPFNIEIAHIHGGETTLGAIDNAYRHAISLFSKHIFVSTEEYKKRAQEIVEKNINVHNVGALSIDNLNEIDFLTKADFKDKFNIDLSLPTILSTFHPETVSFKKNETYIKELLISFESLKNEFQIVITLPNTDTMGQMIRDEIIKFGKNFPEVKIIESFGMLGYLTCMQYCSFLLGNTSSGFVEASYFPKYVINLGDRQKGRLETENIITTPITSEQILKTVAKIKTAKTLQNLHTYGKGNTAKKIVNILKHL